MEASANIPNPLLNPFTPLAFLPPSAARNLATQRDLLSMVFGVHIKILIFLSFCPNPIPQAWCWDVLTNILEEVHMCRLTFSDLIYFLSLFLITLYKDIKCLYKSTIIFFLFTVLTFLVDELITFCVVNYLCYPYI